MNIPDVSIYDYKSSYIIILVILFSRKSYVILFSSKWINQESIRCKRLGLGRIGSVASQTDPAWEEWVGQQVRQIRLGKNGQHSKSDRSGLGRMGRVASQRDQAWKGWVGQQVREIMLGKNGQGSKSEISLGKNAQGSKSERLGLGIGRLASQRDQAWEQVGQQVREFNLGKIASPGLDINRQKYQA